VGRVRPCLLNIKIFFKTLASTPHVKALGLISEFQPMRSTDFDNLKQQNGLDSSCKAALSMGPSIHIIQCRSRPSKK
jgi:hypothetical protein